MNLRRGVSLLSPVLFFSFYLTALAQTAPPPKRVVVRAGRLLDVKSGKMLADQAIVIEGDKIVSIGPANSAQMDGATAIDLSRQTVLPGLIDAHVHLTGDPRDSGYNRLGFPFPAKRSPAQRTRASLCWRVSPRCVTS